MSLIWFFGENESKIIKSSISHLYITIDNTLDIASVRTHKDLSKECLLSVHKLPETVVKLKNR